ncbi:phospholipid phosphatase 1-like [Gigantopelta aegis]|uniref:phospholipid phosphatase 1-like n=1 Tax=Gigantopelta aegis TaxID=1735272 RepID=UPI001B88D970|nr:phospholipid phosphatase 1-like [Gigantopelta aegis]
MIEKRVYRKIAIDVVSVCVLAVPILVFITVMKPYHRGFFCDDESLMHPFKEDTIPTWLLGVIGLGLPIICVLTIEALLTKTNKGVILPKDVLSPKIRPYLERCYDIIRVFIFGTAATQFLTEIGKFSVGRLRPHFFDVCKPNITKCTSTLGYVTDDVCEGTDIKKILHARLSFPSGHASISIFCMVYLMVYLQIRLKIQGADLAKAVLQVVAITLAIFTCLSRISDYKHHWGDVLGGALLGFAVCVLVVWCLSVLVPDVSLQTILLSISGNQMTHYRRTHQESSESQGSEGMDGLTGVAVNN